MQFNELMAYFVAIKRGQFNPLRGITSNRISLGN